MSIQTPTHTRSYAQYNSTITLSPVPTIIPFPCDDLPITVDPLHNEHNEIINDSSQRP
jgi:hypothetical protein